MSDAELIARLRERAVQERIIQKNNEAVAAALMGQRLLFDQGIHSASNSFAVRLGLEHENCAKNDAALAHDWDEAADRIELLTAESQKDGEEILYLRERAEQLAKAVAVLNAAVKWADRYRWAAPWVDAAHAVLAELEGK